ncbi:MAG: hypothetical protein QM401_06235 [Bacillota bacterium]|nr:hypothetical protein [Bacillota bacterium]HHU60418.1 hypothetical protein [Natronincola sp.]
MGELWSRLNEKQRKIIGWLAIATIIGIAVLLLSPTQVTQIQDSGSKQAAPVNINIDECSWEKELTQILNALLGGKRSQVFLTLERGPQINIARNETEEERTLSDGSVERRWTSTPVILRNDESRKEMPLILDESEPIVRGVLIVVEYEPQAELRLEIARAVSTALQLPMHRIEVLFKK